MCTVSIFFPKKQRASASGINNLYHTLCGKSWSSFGAHAVSNLCFWLCLHKIREKENTPPLYLRISWDSRVSERNNNPVHVVYKRVELRRSQR